MDEKTAKAYLEILGFPEITPEKEKALEDDLSRIIKEDKHLDLCIGQAAFGYLKKCLKPIPTKVDVDRLKSLLSKSWTYYNDFCINFSSLNLFLLESDFSKPMHAAMQLQKLNPNLSVKEAARSLAGSMKSTYGLAFKLTDEAYVLLINSDIMKDENKIQHEFGHFVSEVTGKLILDDTMRNSVLRYFNVNEDIVEYIFHKREWWINIVTDLFNGLQRIYWSLFSKVYDWETFIEIHFTELKSKVANWRDATIVKLWNADIKGNEKDRGKTFYFNVLAAVAYVKSDLFDEVVEKLKNRPVKT